ncbi:hypothetical protein COCCU_05795 [Corynebacterium occultum]|uniref:DUF1684 domain-containing protein n=1 Tax=Corynebacterium occultum TaxID=2675219 RepID=A0A6B8VSH0_9CORY|nr:DUF1684 domain-containing protein [Corynebacterium occultum]QGU07103.1 hypothetical protein COCCU_05795 [Corynebacterium occultum]
MPNNESFQRDFEAFRSFREEIVAAPFGPLSPIGMAWLDENPVRVHGAPGQWSFIDGEVRLSLKEGENLMLDDQPLNPDYTEVTLNLGEVDVAGIFLQDGEKRIEVALRGSRPIVRPRDPSNHHLNSHLKVPTFPADPAWVIEGTFRPYAEPEEIIVASVLEGAEHRQMVRGTVHFEVAGRPQRLLALATGNPYSLGLHFTDETSGKTTWKDVRVTTAALQEDGETVIIDFNKTLNQPCAFTDYATCPLPAPGDHLDVEITAGEMIPEGR